jgi:hypothetical protein
MPDFLMDSRTGAAPASMCEPCGCCEPVNIRPGETIRMGLNYASWIAALRARGIVAGGTEILVHRQNVTAAGIAADLSFAVSAPGQLSVSVALPGDLAGATYSLANTPVLGTASVGASTGALVYNVAAGSSGEELLIVAVSQGAQTVMRRVLIEVTAQADFSFVASAGRQFVGSLFSPTDLQGSKYQVAGGLQGATIYVEPGLNGVRSVLNPANLAAVGPNYFTYVQTKLGSVEVSWDGRFWYLPQDNVSGLDTFTVNVVDSSGNISATRTVVIQLQEVWVNADRVNVKTPWLWFPVTAQRDAKIGDVWRITVYQQAQDCQACSYEHVSCFDITVSDC